MSIKSQNLEAELLTLGENARKAAEALRLASSEQRADAINKMAKHVRANAGAIFSANSQDMKSGAKKGLSAAMLDRLELDSERIEAMACGLESVAKLPDPIGKIDERWSQPNGLTFAKVRTPIGIIGMIYESRPNVTADAASLSVKSANACILRGGSEATNSNLAIHAAITAALAESGLPETCVQYVNTTNRDAVGYMLAGLNGNIDLIIPRGGKSLVKRVQDDARVPVLAHLEGRNHTYVHTDADPHMARDILLNAKLRRTGICGATETLIIDAGAIQHLPMIGQALRDKNCLLKGDKQARAILPTIDLATQEDFETEYLDAILNIKVVKDIDEALAHIAKFGSGHTDAIITDNADAAKRFLKDVDSAIVMHNTSTQFADGGEFGFGAEIGIATGRLHARGPVGAQHLTSYKYHVMGTGQTRP